MQWLNDLLNSFYNAQWHVTDSQAIYYREIVGNVFGLASALLGMWRKVWTWPIGRSRPNSGAPKSRSTRRKALLSGWRAGAAAAVAL